VGLIIINLKLSMSDQWEYFLYAKFYTNVHYDNMYTYHIKIGDLNNTDYTKYENVIKVESYAPDIDKNYDKELYKIIIYKKCNQATPLYVTVVGINLDKLNFIYTNSLQIPNIDMFHRILFYNNKYILYANVKNFDITCIYRSLIQTINLSTEEYNDEPIPQPTELIKALPKYQRKTIHWMLDKELRNQTGMSTRHHYDYSDIANYKIGDFNFVLDNHKELILRKGQLLVPKGGVLVDNKLRINRKEIITLALKNKYMGTTYFIDKQVNSNATLIVCSEECVSFWIQTITELIDPTIKIKICDFSTPAQYGNYTYKDLLEADFVITTISALYGSIIRNGVPIYREGEKLLTRKSVNLFDIYWHRIVVDDFEKLYCELNAQIFDNLSARFKWCILNDVNEHTNLFALVKFIHEYHLNCSFELIHYITNNFIRNEKEFMYKFVDSMIVI